MTMESPIEVADFPEEVPWVFPNKSPGLQVCPVFLDPAKPASSTDAVFMAWQYITVHMGLSIVMGAPP